VHTQTKHKFTATEKKILTLASLGGMLEFYDFIIYGVFSVYFASQFFPSDHSFMSIIESYVVFVLGYLARPIGGILFSHIGDEYGRKQVLIITIVLMGMSSLGIGLLPTYNAIGNFAPVLLLVLRLLQGLALGGELPSTYVYIRESIPHKANMSFGIIMGGIISGLLLGMMIDCIMNLLWSPQQIAAFGWRIPFILGGFLCLISYKIRQQLHETHAFERITDKPAFPLIYLMKHHFIEVIIGTFVTATLAATIVICIIFMPTYLQKIIHIDSHFVSLAVLLITMISVSMAFVTGYITERLKLNLNLFLKHSIIMSAILVGVSYYFISTQQLLFTCFSVLGIITGIFSMLSPAIITTLFPTKVRLSGVALCYNLGFSIFGGLAPVIIVSAIDKGANMFLTPVIYLWIIYALGFIGISVTARSSFGARISVF
jgi:MFS family permease